ncbi:MAG: DUF4347 domain-containing protein, partial [Cyanobacteria bacterium J06642_9]
MHIQPGSVVAVTGHTLVFVDAGIEDYQTLVKGTAAGAKTFILDPAKDGIDTITQIVAQYRDIESIHIIAHGVPGCLFLGNSELSLDTLKTYQAQIQTWFAQTTIFEPSLLLYGCNAAYGDAGEEFITKLHNLTHANIAAASHPVGNTQKGGSWQLDQQRGQVQQDLAVTPAAQQTYAGILSIDSDNDGLMDDYDPDPWNPDIDGDGLLDGNDPLPYIPDMDGDGLIDGIDDPDPTTPEPGTDPMMADSDQDGIPDAYDFAPMSRDADGDGWLDGSDPDPWNPDVDGDGIKDGYDSDPWNPSVTITTDDSDGDGLPDYSDPSPYNPDADGDGITDMSDPNPLVAFSAPSNQPLPPGVNVDIAGFQGSTYFSDLTMGTPGPGNSAPSAKLTVDTATGAIYIAAQEGDGVLHQLSAHKNLSIVTDNFANGGFFPYAATDIHFANGYVYTITDDSANGGGQLIQIDPNTGVSTVLDTLPMVGGEAGLDFYNGKLYFSDGISSTNEIWSYDLTTGELSPFLSGIPSEVFSVEIDAVRGMLYFSSMNGSYAEFFKAALTDNDPYMGSGYFTFVGSAYTNNLDGEFAVDPSGEYLFFKTETEVQRITVADGPGMGMVETFASGLSSNSMPGGIGDLAFGASSSGSGASLFVLDGETVLEFQGFNVGGSGDPLPASFNIYAPGHEGFTYFDGVTANYSGYIPAKLTVDANTGAVFFADQDGSGTLHTINPDKTLSTVATNFTNGGFFPSWATDIQTANGFVYTSIQDGQLLEIDPNSGTSNLLKTLPGFGYESGLDVYNNKIYISDGSGSANEIWEYDLTTGVGNPFISGLPSEVYSVEIDRPRNALYFSAYNGSTIEFYRAELNTGMWSPIGQVSFPSPVAELSGEFAIDPSGEYLYYRTETAIERMSVTTGMTSVFMDGFSGFVENEDLTFGRSSWGFGSSLYILNGETILEVGGFSASGGGNTSIGDGILPNFELEVYNGFDYSNLLEEDQWFDLNIYNVGQEYDGITYEIDWGDGSP